MKDDGTGPERSIFSAERVDPEILGAALEMLEQGLNPDVASLASRFGDRDGDIVPTLDAVRSYRKRLADAKQIRSVPGDDVLEPGTALGDYTITGLLGRGAMGVVYRAKQEALGGREVALKVLPSELVARDPRFLERFRREAELAATIHAPNIAEVHDFGSVDGRFFLAMRLVEGPSLAEVLEELCRRRRLGRMDHTRVEFVRQATRLVRDVARALATVHAAGLVHRDVKPSNLILERTAEEEPTDLAGTSILVDFGLLRPTDSSDLTGSMTILGTPAFAAPEVKLGHGSSARSDVFSLGVVLHDLLTLTRPVDRAAASTGLEGVRAINPGVDARLAAIVEKAVEQKPAFRYADGEDFARDLDRFLRGETVRAMPTRPWLRLSLWVRRNPVSAIRRGVLAGLLVFLVIPVMVLGAQAAIRVYSLANSALEYDEEGDLGQAATAFGALRAEHGWASFLPGLSQATNRAEHYAKPDFDAACRQLVADAQGSSDHTHGELLRLLFSTEDKETRRDGFRFLVWEMQHDESLTRRVMAARTCAHFFLVKPRPFLPSADGEEHQRELDQLEAVLSRAARSDSTNGLGLELRRYSVSALSGMGQTSFGVLVEMLHDEDLELKSIASFGGTRAWHQLYHELAGRPSAAQEQIDQDLLARWANACWRATREHLARTRSEDGYSTTATRTTRKDRFLNLAGRDSLLRIALIRALLKEAGLLTEWSSLYPDLREHLLRLQATCEELLRGGSPQPLKPDSTKLFRGWSDVMLNEDEAADWNQLLLKPEKHLGVIRDRTSHEFENIWTVPDVLDSGRVVPDDFAPDAPMARFFFENGDPRIDGCAKLAEWTHASTLMARDNFQDPNYGLGDQKYVLQLVTPGISEILFTATKPEGSIGANVRICHEVPCRTVLPLEGRAKIEMDLCGGKIVSLYDLRTLIDPVSFAIPHRVFDRNDQIQLHIRHLGGDAIYWLWQIVIDFEFPPDEKE